MPKADQPRFYWDEEEQRIRPRVSSEPGAEDETRRVTETPPSAETAEAEQARKESESLAEWARNRRRRSRIR